MPWSDGDYLTPFNLNAKNFVGTKTVNAAFYKTASITNEAAITLAIVAAALLGSGAAVWVPGSMLPYNASLVTYNQNVRMLREGGNPEYFDVKAFGAAGDGVADDTTAIQRAITACVGTGLNPFGGIIYFPSGRYVYTATLQIPVTANITVTLKGAGMRNTYLYPSGPSTNFSLNSDSQRVCFIVGALTPDAAGVFTNVSTYIGWEDLSQNGSLISSGSVVAHQLTELNYGWMKNAIIEAFPNNSVGLYLRGSTVTGGLGTGTTAPHTRLCRFDNCLIVTIGSNNLGGTPVLLQNADENDWYNCVHGTTPGQTVSADSIIATNIQLGRNNRFFGVLYSGDTTALKTGYVGLKFGPPVNAAGVPNGGVNQNQDYGAVAEGFDICFWVGADASGNTLGNYVNCANPSIYTTAWKDDTPSGGGFTGGGAGGNTFLCPLLGIMQQSVMQACAPTATFLNNSTTPAVTGSNSWVAGNSSPTSITDFLQGQDGQRLLIRFSNGNTTIRDTANSGVGNIRTIGRADYVGSTEMIMEFQKIGNIWQMISPPRWEGGPFFGFGTAVATNAVRGFVYLPSCAGTPTGVPFNLVTGSVPMIFDTTGVKLWIYTGGSWKGVVVA